MQSFKVLLHHRAACRPGGVLAGLFWTDADEIDRSFPIGALRQIASTGGWGGWTIRKLLPIAQRIVAASGSPAGVNGVRTGTSTPLNGCDGMFRAPLAQHLYAPLSAALPVASTPVCNPSAPLQSSRDAGAARVSLFFPAQQGKNRVDAARQSENIR